MDSKLKGLRGPKIQKGKIPVQFIVVWQITRQVSVIEWKQRKTWSEFGLRPQLGPGASLDTTHATIFLPISFLQYFSDCICQGKLFVFLAVWLQYFCGGPQVGPGASLVTTWALSPPPTCPPVPTTCPQTGFTLSSLPKTPSNAQESRGMFWGFIDLIEN